MKEKSQVDLQDALTACHLRYFEGRSQAEIAGHLRTNRTRVHRLLTTAREMGWIHVKIDPPTNVVLEASLSGLLADSGIRNVRVAVDGVAQVGHAAARYFEELARSQCTVVLDGGWTVAAFTVALTPNRFESVTICPIAADPPSYGVSAYEQMWSMSLIYPKDVRRLRPPHFGQGSPELKELRSDVRQKARAADFVVLGVGPWKKGFTALEFTTHIGLSSNQLFRQYDNIKAMCGYCAINENGRHVSLPPVDERMFRALEIADLRQIAKDPKRDVMIVAAGEEKLVPLVTAINARICNVLVIDQDLGAALEKLVSAEPEIVAGIQN